MELEWWHKRQEAQHLLPVAGCSTSPAVAADVKRSKWQATVVLLTPLRALSACLWAVLQLRRPVVAAAGVLATSTACAFLPGFVTVPMGLAALASQGWPPWPTRQARRSPAAAWLWPLRALRGPALALTCVRLALPPTLPAVWRALQYWQRSVPILARFLVTHARAQRLYRQGRREEAEAAWERQHRQAADQLFDMLASIQGFYVKLAQILATKTDMLPRLYTDSLAQLMDRLPPTPWPRVARLLEQELRRPLDQVFVPGSLETFPLASATVAQVHVGQLRRQDEPLVAIKVQHRGVRGMMQADLANMRLFVDLCKALRIDLGFDLGSVVREYQRVVPDEFRFDKEANAMVAIRENLRRHAQEGGLADLRHVVVPTVHPELSTSRVLVMQLLEGVPLLHAAGMSQHIRSSLLHALLLSYGVQILLDGLFHTDPHPGNLLACIDELGDVAVGICDFGQVKRLAPAERLRCAQLVVALASRDKPTVCSTCRELGVRIENCAPDFEEITAYILFDTRMDIPEALQSPLSPDAHPGWRTTRVPALPPDLFFVMRVVTLLRGVLASMGCFTLSSALIWEPIARQVVAEAKAKAAAELQARHEQQRLTNAKRAALCSHRINEGTLRHAELSIDVTSMQNKVMASGGTARMSSTWERLTTAARPSSGAGNQSDMSSSAQLLDDMSLAGMLLASPHVSLAQAHSTASLQLLARQRESADTMDLDTWWDGDTQDPPQGSMFEA